MAGLQTNCVRDLIKVAAAMLPVQQLLCERTLFWAQLSVHASKMNTIVSSASLCNKATKNSSQDRGFE